MGRGGNNGRDRNGRRLDRVTLATWFLFDGVHEFLAVLAGDLNVVALAATGCGNGFYGDLSTPSFYAPTIGSRGLFTRLTNSFAGKLRSLLRVP